MHDSDLSFGLDKQLVSCKNRDGRPGPFYHVNDVSVYLGRQRGRVPHQKNKLEALSCSFCQSVGVSNAHEAKMYHSSSWFKMKNRCAYVFFVTVPMDTHNTITTVQETKRH